MSLNTIDIDKTNESEFDEVADYRDERFAMFSPTNVNNRLILRSYWPCLITFCFNFELLVTLSIDC